MRVSFLRLSAQIAENLGIEMVFSLVSSAQEWLNQRWDEHKADEENQRLAKVQAYEEAERVSLPDLAYSTLARCFDLFAQDIGLKMCSDIRATLLQDFKFIS